MSSIISILALGALSLFVMLWPLWQRRADRGLGVGIESDNVAELWEREKDRLLQEQNDLDMALAEGKISPQVHAEERAQVMNEAKRALERLRRARAREEKMASSADHKPRVYPLVGASFASLILIGTMALILELKGQDVQRAVQKAEAPQVKMSDIQNMVASLEARVEAGEGTLKDKLMLARSYFVLGKRDRSIDLYTAIHKEDEKNLPAMLALGEIYFNSKEKDEQALALSFFEKALVVSPDQAEALWFKSLALVRARKFSEARVVLAHLKSVTKDNRQAQDAVARLLEELDKNIPASKLEYKRNDQPEKRSDDASRLEKEPANN